MSYFFLTCIVGDGDSDGGNSSQELNFYPSAADILRKERQRRAPYSSRFEMTDEKQNSKAQNSNIVSDSPIQGGVMEPLLPKPRFGTLRDNREPNEESLTPVAPPRVRRPSEHDSQKRHRDNRPHPRTPK